MNIDLLISRAAGVGASDLHLICGLPPQYRIDGALQPDPKLPPLTAQDCEDLAQQLAGWKTRASWMAPPPLQVPASV